VASGDGTAPAPLPLVQSFASTLPAGPGADPLAGRDDAVAWLRAAGLLPDGAGLTGSEHAALLRLRAAIRDTLATHAGAATDPGTAARLTKALADGRLVITVEPGGTIRLASAARAVYPSLVATLAVAIADAAAAGTWPHLKLCTAPHCGQAFYGTTAGGRHCPAHAA